MKPHPDPYHLRRAEKAIAEPNERLEVIRSQKHMTLALCRDGEPYLVTVNYGYDRWEDCFYFHCATEGKKIDYLRTNPVVWGQVLEDLGYQAGACDQAYRTVQFRGLAEIVTDLEEKRRALRLMIEHLEPDPEPVLQKLLREERVRSVGIVRVRVLEMSGKKSLAAERNTALLGRCEDQTGDARSSNATIMRQHLRDVRVAPRFASRRSATYTVE